MLKSVIRTDKETKEYLKRLRRRLKEQRKAPVEGMAEFFAARINEYESVHLGNFRKFTSMRPIFWTPV